MSQLRRKAMTPEEFLAWEAGQGLKWEIDGFEPVAMTGGTDAHAAIQVNTIVALGSRLRGRPCYVRGAETKVQMGPGYRYPDAFVSCTSVARDATVAADPVVIFEVVSESTGRTDRTVRLAKYRALSFRAALRHAGTGPSRCRGVHPRRNRLGFGTAGCLPVCSPYRKSGWRSPSPSCTTAWTSPFRSRSRPHPFGRSTTLVHLSFLSRNVL